MGNGGETETYNAEYSDEDPEEERRRIFGEESNGSQDEEAQDSDDSCSELKDENEDEFMLVLQAIRERKKYESDLERPFLKDKID